MTYIRQASPADAVIVDEMVRELAAHEDSIEHVLAGPEEWRALLARPEVIVLIAEEDGEPVGFTSTVRRLHLWSGRDLVALDDLYVRPGHRSNGVGADLMNTVAGLASEDDLLVLWGVRLDNHAGQRFYARLGASLATKMTASWTPAQYRRHLAVR
jgi:GNAT superfamily N-acetyltransferase